MSRYIDAEKIKITAQTYKSREDCETYLALSDVKKSVDMTPTEDVVPVVHGRWCAELVERENRKGRIMDYVQLNCCSVCHKQPMIGREYNYCPYCGAKMDEVKPDD